MYRTRRRVRDSNGIMYYRVLRRFEAVRHPIHIYDTI